MVDRRRVHRTFAALGGLLLLLALATPAAIANQDAAQPAQADEAAPQDSETQNVGVGVGRPAPPPPPPPPPEPPPGPPAPPPPAVPTAPPAPAAPPAAPVEELAIPEELPRTGPEELSWQLAIAGIVLVDLGYILWSGTRREPLLRRRKS